MKKNILIFASLSAIVIFYFWGLWSTYFSQDEWNGFGVIITLAHKPIWAWFDLATSLHFFPFNSLTWLLMYRAYGFQAQYFAITAIILHIIASFLAYILAKRLSKNEFVGILTAILFATNAQAREAVMHLGVFSNTIPFFIFTMVFFIVLTHLLKRNIYEIKHALLLGGIFICAVFFREDAFILLPLLMLFLFIFNKSAISKKNKLFFLTFYGIGIGYLIYRIALQLLTPHADAITGHAYFMTYFYNGLTFPIKLIVQNIIDGYYGIELFLYQNSHIFYGVNFSFDIINSVFFDFAILVIFNIFAIMFYFLAKNIKNTIFWKNIYFALVFIFLDAEMLASIGRRMVRIEERYLYLSSFAVFFILSLIITELYKKRIFRRSISIMTKILPILILLFFLILSYQRIQSDIRSLQVVGRVRNSIISSIVAVHPHIPKNTIFFVRCRQSCYRNSAFGIYNQFVLPFSSGPGWIILLQYANNNELAYKDFFSYNGDEVVWNWQENKFKKSIVSQFLWDTGAQGYRNLGSYGFGYFTDINLLQQTITKQHLDKKIVIGLEYDEKNSTVKDISLKIQNELN